VDYKPTLGQKHPELVNNQRSTNLFVSLPCVVLFGLMATRLNKHYYYYQHATKLCMANVVLT